MTPKHSWNLYKCITFAKVSVRHYKTDPYEKFWYYALNERYVSIRKRWKNVRISNIVENTKENLSSLPNWFYISHF